MKTEEWGKVLRNGDNPPFKLLQYRSFLEELQGLKEEGNYKRKCALPRGSCIFQACFQAQTALKRNSTMIEATNSAMASRLVCMLICVVILSILVLPTDRLRLSTDIIRKRIAPRTTPNAVVYRVRAPIEDCFMERILAYTEEIFQRQLPYDLVVLVDETKHNGTTTPSVGEPPTSAIERRKLSKNKTKLETRSETNTKAKTKYNTRRHHCF